MLISVRPLGAPRFLSSSVVIKCNLQHLLACFHRSRLVTNSARVGICGAKAFNQSIDSYLNGAKSQPEESPSVLQQSEEKQVNPSEQARCDSGQEKSPLWDETKDHLLESLARWLASASSVSVVATGGQNSLSHRLPGIRINGSSLDGAEKNTTLPNMLISDHDGRRRVRQVLLTTQSITQSIGSTASLRLANQCS